MSHVSELEAAVRATLRTFAADPNADTLCDLSRAMSRLSSYAGSGKSTGRDREIPGHWIDSSAACDHAHEHIQNMNSAFASGTTPTESDVRTIKYAVFAATALFGDAVRSDTPPSAGAHTPHSTDPEDDFSVFGIARAAAHLLGSGWQAEPG
ncbi:hypothetical protein EF919_38490, partial [Streptomyces sp. WAC02707]|uniref:hypothetical protein n=1 Tax=Streptomyces sp. WAC02707 TaxID=2487417 RepID=UPI000F7B35C2